MTVAAAASAAAAGPLVAGKPDIFVTLCSELMRTEATGRYRCIKMTTRAPLHPLLAPVILRHLRLHRAQSLQGGAMCSVAPTPTNAHCQKPP